MSDAIQQADIASYRARPTSGFSAFELMIMEEGITWIGKKHRKTFFEFYYKCRRRFDPFWVVLKECGRVPDVYVR